MARQFRDRQDAGRQLADALQMYAMERPIVVALPRGGVPVAYEVARALKAPLDVCVVRKIGVPWHPELGIGAVAEGGHLFLSRQMVSTLEVSEEELERAIDMKRREVEDRIRRFRGEHPRLELRGRTVLLIDDGIATGGTARAAIASLRSEDPAQIVLAAPVAAPDTIEELRPAVDRIVAVSTPRELHAIGLWYQDFTQVPDDDVVRLLAQARAEMAASED